MATLWSPLPGFQLAPTRVTFSTRLATVVPVAECLQVAVRMVVATDLVVNIGCRVAATSNLANPSRVAQHAVADLVPVAR